MAAVKKIPEQNVAAQAIPKNGGKISGNDQVAEDIKKFKQATDKFSTNIRKTFEPIVGEKLPIVHTAKAGFSSVTTKIFDPELIKKIFKILVLILMLLALFYIGSQIFTSVINDDDDTNDITPTPSIGEFRPYKPSVYAEDELILKLDEDIKVLERELSTTQLKEEILDPPALDFEINFKE